MTVCSRSKPDQRHKRSHTEHQYSSFDWRDDVLKRFGSATRDVYRALIAKKNKREATRIGRLYRIEVSKMRMLSTEKTRDWFKAIAQVD